MEKKRKNVIKRFFMHMQRWLPKLKGAMLTYYYIPLAFALTCLVFVACLYVIDRVMPYFSSLPHNRTGDAWFSVLGCLLPSVASILLSLVAIQQTQKINMLDRKMRRPALAFQGAKLTVLYLYQGNYECSEPYRSMSAQQQSAVRDYFGDQQNEPYYGLLKIDLRMLLKNEINIEKIEMINFKFVIRGKEYLFARNEKMKDSILKRKKFQSLKHKFENGIESYDFQYTMIAFEPKKAEVWKELRNAMNNEELLNPCYEEFQLEIAMEVKFGLDGERDEALKVKINFCGEEGFSSAEDAVACVSTENGRLVYC